MMRRICGAFLLSYVLLCVGSLVLISLNAAGAFGMEPDPLSAVFAIVLAMPWSLWIADYLPTNRNDVLVVALIIGMALNAAILRLLFHVLPRK